MLSRDFDDTRNVIAVSLMGWASKLATRDYREHLARWISIGMSVDQPPAPSLFEQMGGTIIGPNPRLDCCGDDGSIDCDCWCCGNDECIDCDGTRLVIE